jgi:sensor histidine kinase YesM
MTKDNSFLKRFVVLPKWAWLRHSLLIIYLFLSLFLWNESDVGLSDQTAILKDPKKTAYAITQLRLYSLCILITAIILVYVNLYFLIKKFFFTKKYFVYTIVVILLVLLFVFIHYGLFQFFFKDYGETIAPFTSSIYNLLAETLTPLAFIGSTTGIKVFKQWMIDSDKFAELQNTELQNELTHLKNQVNPHFLFNTLNNIRTLNETDTKKANQVLLGLSDILRYQIYDSNKELMVLSKDIAILDDYLLLEKIRRDNFSYQIVVDGDANAVMVPPLLFINFVENAIKHGASARDMSFCNLHFNINSGKLYFTCVNSKPSVVMKSKGGLGIKNIERRLQLLYPGNHTLNVKDEVNSYTVQLTIPV